MNVQDWFEERLLPGFVPAEQVEGSDPAANRVLQEVAGSVLSLLSEAVLYQALPDTEIDRLVRWVEILDGCRQVSCQRPIFPALCRFAYQV